MRYRGLEQRLTRPRLPRLSRSLRAVGLCFWGRWSLLSVPSGGSTKSVRVRLVEPRPPGHTVYDYAMLPRLGLPLIGALLSRAGHDVKAYCELLAPVDLGECLAADMVGISTTTSTAPSAYRLADMLSVVRRPRGPGRPAHQFPKRRGPRSRTLRSPRRRPGHDARARRSACPELVTSPASRACRSGDRTVSVITTRPVR